MSSHKYVCSVCHSPNVEMAAWVNVNSLEYSSEYEGEDAYYCNNCKKRIAEVVPDIRRKLG